VSTRDRPRISVVVPTYNRGRRLGETVSSILASRLDAVGRAELIVVDDGSPIPASLADVVAPEAIPLRLLRQENAGPAAARNAGFRAAQGEIVLFVDDDIIVPAQLLQEHVSAHARLGDVVVCGRCVLERPQGGQSLYAYLEGAGQDPGRDLAEEFVPIHVVASGQISVRRATFARDDGVYRQDLKTPGAEEFELSMRLRARSIPAYLATRIAAVHGQAVDIDSISRQQYKHGMGYAEAAVKYPETLALPEMAAVIQACGPPTAGGSATGTAKRLLKDVASSPVVRGGVLALARGAGRFPLPARAQAALYHAAISSHFIAGVRRGLQTFGKSP
jgi:GT2 family glycosyltransferase